MEKSMFVLVEASKLILDDEFMQHKPKNKREQMLGDCKRIKNPEVILM